MATITSPRIASPLPTPNSSRRTSLDTLSRSNTGSPAQAAAPIPPAQARRNRTALRDYYGLKTQVAPASDTASLQEQRNDGEIPEGKLDAPGFEPEKYVKEVLEREGLEELLKEEGGLMSEIQGLDGERKALVYDNYSKLIAATDTIRNMRVNMDPLAPTTSTLSPAIAHIAGTAATLQASLKERTKIEDAEKSEDVKAKREQSAREKATVRWVVDAPMRLAERVEKGEKEEAEREWKEIQGLLDKWNGVKGVDDVREECLKVLRGRQ